MERQLISLIAKPAHLLCLVISLLCYTVTTGTSVIMHMYSHVQNACNYTN